MRTILATVLTKKRNYFEVMLPAKRIVCPRCDGNGVHDNPHITGLTQRELRDEDFREAYMRGDYDVTCECCEGNKVLDVVDEESLSPKMLSRYECAQEQARRDEREAAMERRMGA